MSHVRFQPAPVLRAVIRAETQLFGATDDVALTAEIRAAQARAQRALAPFESDPLKSGSMSPTQTGLAASQREFGAVGSLIAKICPNR